MSRICSVNRAGLLALSVLLLSSAACGKKGPLIYPDMLIAEAPQKVVLEQSGNSLRISFDLPNKDLSGRKAEEIESVLISRHVYKDKNSKSCNDKYQELRKIELDFPEPAKRLGNRVIWEDSDLRSGEWYQYRIQTFQKNGVKGTVATTGLATLISPPLPPKLKATPVFGGVIILEVTGEIPKGTTLLGYKVYRAAGNEQPMQISSLSNGKVRYDDQSVQHGVVYQYLARMIVRSEDGMIVESESSESVMTTVAEDPK